MGLRVDVEISDGKVVKGAKTVERSLNDIDKAASKTEKAVNELQVKVDSFVSTQTGLGRTINESNQIVSANGRVLKGLTHEYNQLLVASKKLDTGTDALGAGLEGLGQDSDEAARQIAQLQRQVDIANVRMVEGARGAKLFEASLNTSSKATAAQHAEIQRLTGQLHDLNRQTGGGRGMALTNIGYQLQDATVQLQMGTSAFVVAAQQVPQALVGFGPMGAIAGTVVALGAALGGVLAPNLFKTTNHLKDVATAVEQAERALSVSAEGIFTFTEDVKLLAKYNLQLADSFIEVAKAQNTQAQVAAQAALRDAFKSTAEASIDLTQSLTGTLRPTTQQRDLALGLADTMLKLSKGENLAAEEQVKLLDTLRQLEPTTDSAKSRVNALITSITDYGLTSAKTEQLNKFLGKSFQELSKSEFESSNASRIATESRNAQNAAQKEAIRLMKEEASFAQEAIEAEQRRRQGLTQQFEQTQFAVLSPEEQQRMQLEKTLMMISEYGALSAEAEQQAQDLRTAVVAQAEKDRFTLQAREQTKTLGMVSSGFDSLSQIAGAFVGDQENQSKDALRFQQGLQVAAASMNLASVVLSAMNDPTAITLPQKLAQAGAIAAAAAPLVSTIAQATFATGGYVAGGGTGTSDSINARLSNGEFVMRETVTRRHRSALDYMNRTGDLPSSGSGTQINMTVIDNAGVNVSTETQQNGDIIMTIDKRMAEKLPGMMGKELANPNSQASASVRKQFRVQRN